MMRSPGFLRSARGVAVALLLAIPLLAGLACSGREGAAAAASPAGGGAASPQAQLEALEPCLETYLALHGAPPKTMGELTDFYTRENRLNPLAPRITEKDWTLAAALAPDAWRDPTDPQAPGIRWTWATAPAGVTNGRGHFRCQARGLVIRLRHRGDPAVQLLKWLPLAEQLALATQAEGEARVRLLQMWRDSLAPGAEGEAMLKAILPELDRALDAPAPAVREATGECLGRALQCAFRPCDPANAPEPLRELLRLARKAATRIQASPLGSALMSLRGIDNEAWLALMNQWADDADPAVRAATVRLLASKDSPLLDVATIIQRLRQDQDPAVRREARAFEGQHMNLFLGSSGHLFLLAGESFPQTLLAILRGTDAAAQCTVLKGIRNVEYPGLLTSPFSQGDPEIKKEVDEALAPLARSSNPVLALHARKLLRLGADEQLIEALLKTGDLEALRELKSHMLLTFPYPMAERVQFLSERKRMVVKYALLAPPDLAVAFLGLDNEHILDLLTSLYLTPDEALPLVTTWIDSPDARLRLAVVGQIHGLEVRAKKSPLTAEQARQLEGFKGRLLGDPNPKVALAAATRLLPNAAEPRLAWLRRQADPARRDAALKWGTPAAPWMKEELLRLFEQGDLATRWEVAARLAALGEGARVRAFWRELGPRALVLFSRADFRALTIALNTYDIDMGDGLKEIHSLTTPIAYLPALPGDPFRGDGAMDYQFTRIDKSFAFIFRGVGPDGKSDPGLSAAVNALGAATERLGGDALKGLRPYAYDPTNGVLSGGRLFVLPAVKGGLGWRGAAGLKSLVLVIRNRNREP